MHSSANQEIDRYLRTGDHDALGEAQPGNSIYECCRTVDLGLRNALVGEVLARTRDARAP
jgi:hypothetical protein